MNLASLEPASRYRILLVLLSCALCCAPLSVRAAMVERIFSRDHPSFDPARARLEVGRDGRAYLTSRGNPSVVVAVTLDGRERTDHFVGDAGEWSVSNGNVIAVLNTHFSHSIAFYDTSFRKLDSFDDFLVNDTVGWDAPGGLELGESGDFFVLDQHRDRIVRLDARAQVVGSYATGNEIVDAFRVDERRRRLFLLTRSQHLVCRGFDGNVQWSTQVDVGRESGGFDVDDSGVVYALAPFSERVRRYGDGGAPQPDVSLEMADDRPERPEQYVTALRIRGDEIVVKLRRSTELFERYDRRSGRRIAVAPSDHEHVRVSYDDDVWTAGRDERLSLTQVGNLASPAVRWRLWARRLDGTVYAEWPLRSNAVNVPPGASGLYEIVLSSDVRPPRPIASDDSRIRFAVEVREPSARGTLSVFTVDNRSGWRRGEPIPFTLATHGGGDAAIHATLALIDDRGREVAKSEYDVAENSRQDLLLGEHLTASLALGRYLLTARAPGFSVAPQSLEIGSETEPVFHRIQYGDYAPLYPTADPLLSPSIVETTRERTRTLGFDLVVDRLGEPQQKSVLPIVRNRLEVSDLRKNLETDATRAVPEKAVFASTLGQLLAAYTGSGVRQMAILMGNDAGLPLGDGGFDRRSPAELIHDLTDVTRALEPFAAFRGWSWASNWWVFDQKGADAAASSEEKLAYETAVRRARETGAWDAVLDRVADRRLEYAADAHRTLGKALRGVHPGYVTAAAASYRNVDAYPPISLEGLDETDLQAQFEQIPVPGYAPHDVDFYTRPGRASWAHPEVYNDAGTGDQILSTLFAMAMRGARGVGVSGAVPNWGPLPEDSRSAYAGIPSIDRAANRVLERYGPWLASLESDDRIAIVVSGRMLKIDEFAATTGRYFARILEAYSACLHAGHPASIRFPEDLMRGELAKYDAVLLVGQEVEPEPALAAALEDAVGAGRPVLYDQTSRPSVVGAFAPLGLAFDRFEHDSSPASDDSAYWRFRSYLEATVPALRAKLDAISPAAIGTRDDRLLTTLRRSAGARYLFLVNDAPVPIDVAKLWRVTLGSASLQPRTVKIQSDPRPAAVYDVLAMKRIEPSDPLEADFRSLPVAIFAFLPQRIERVVLDGPKLAAEGQACEWSARVTDADGAAVSASIPLRVRILDTRHRVLEERFVAAGPDGVRGSVVAPLRSAPELTIEATELFSGHAAATSVRVRAVGSSRVDLQACKLEYSIVSPK